MAVGPPIVGSPNQLPSMIPCTNPASRNLSMMAGEFKPRVTNKPQIRQNSSRKLAEYQVQRRFRASILSNFAAARV
jgi:hypothetical protein